MSGSLSIPSKANTLTPMKGQALVEDRIVSVGVIGAGAGLLAAAVPGRVTLPRRLRVAFFDPDLFPGRVEVLTRTRASVAADGVTRAELNWLAAFSKEGAPALGRFLELAQVHLPLWEQHLVHGPRGTWLFADQQEAVRRRNAKGGGAEHRVTRRVDIPIEAQIKIGSTVFASTIRNLSERGLMVEVHYPPKGLSPQVEMRVTIPVDGEPHVVKLVCRVAWYDGSGGRLWLGLDVQGIEDGTNGARYVQWLDQLVDCVESP